MRKFSQFSPQGFISVDLRLYKLLYDHTALIIFQLSIAIENMSKDTGNTPHIRLQHFSQNKIANYSLINLNTSRQVKLSDNTSKHHLSRVTLACFTKTLERRFTLLCFSVAFRSSFLTKPSVLLSHGQLLSAQLACKRQIKNKNNVVKHKYAEVFLVFASRFYFS